VLTNHHHIIIFDFYSRKIKSSIFSRNQCLNYSRICVFTKNLSNRTLFFCSFVLLRLICTLCKSVSHLDNDVFHTPLLSFLVTSQLMGPLADILAERESAYQAASKSPVAGAAAGASAGASSGAASGASAAGAKAAATTSASSSAAAAASATAAVVVAEQTNHMLPIQVLSG
jgi:hypothetical protein